LTLSARGFQNLLSEPRRLVLAGRVAYVMQFGDVPFYSAPIILWMKKCENRIKT
jgi:hypothetical protein